MSLQKGPLQKVSFLRLPVRPLGPLSLSSSWIWVGRDGGEGKGTVPVFSAPASDLVPVECILPRNEAMQSV